MIKIATCDDIEAYIEQIHKLLDGYDFGEEQKIMEFTDGTELLRYLDKSRNRKEQLFDLIVTDIEFTGAKREINAVEALEPYQLLYPDTLKIIYVTAYSTYVKSVANALAYGYMEKPIERDVFYEILDRYKKIRQSHYGKLTYKYRGEIVSVLFRDILYLFSNDRKVYIVTSHGETLEMRETIDHLWNDIFDKQVMFARAGKSYIVNLRQAKNVKINEIVMPDGVKIRVGRKYIDQYRMRMWEFVK